MYFERWALVGCDTCLLLSLGEACLFLLLDTRGLAQVLAAYKMLWVLLLAVLVSLGRPHGGLLVSGLPLSVGMVLCCLVSWPVPTGPCVPAESGPGTLRAGPPCPCVASLGSSTPATASSRGCLRPPGHG